MSTKSKKVKVRVPVAVAAVKPKKKRTKGAKALSKPTSKAGAASAGSMYVACMIDPFSMDACQCPDLFAGQTVAFKLVEEYIITSDANGYAVFGASPGMSNAYSTWTVTAGATGSVASAAHPDQTTVAANYLYARMNCYGVEVTYTGASSTSTGWLTSFIHPYLTDLNTQTISGILDDGVGGRVDAGRVVIGRPNQTPRYESEASAAFMTSTFPCLNFVASGLGATQTVLRMRVTRHMEGLPLKSSLMRGMATSSAADLHAMEVATNLGSVGQVSLNTTAGREQAVKAAKATVMSTVNTVAKPYYNKALEMIGSYGAEFLAGALGAILL